MLEHVSEKLHVQLHLCIDFYDNSLEACPQKLFLSMVLLLEVVHIVQQVFR